MKIIFIVLSFLISVTITQAQVPNIDSLKNELIKTSADTIKIKTVFSLAVYYGNHKPDCALHYARQMVNLAQKSGNKYYETVALGEVGNALGHLGSYTKALEMELKSLQVAEQLKERREERMGFAYLQIGLLDQANGRHANAIANFQKCIRYRKLDGTLDKGIYGLFSQIGSAWLELKNLDSALFYAQKGYSYFLQSPNKIRGSLVFNVLGNVYAKMGNSKLAKNNYRTAIAKDMEIQSNYPQAQSYLGLATLFREEGQKDSCIFYAQKSLQLSRDYNIASYAIKGYEFLTEMYEMQKEPDSTLKYMKLMVAQKETVFSQAKVQQYEMLLFDEDQRQQQLKEAQIAYTNKIKTYILLAIILTSLLIAFILYRNNLQKQKANARLHHQQAKTQRALDELKHTQAQLIQQEKMASLGELTAGIAHEIQNPLNFVNNFSEVNKELLLEMKDEIGKGNIEEVKSIADDLISNQEKINHHGKRADAIVKGMMQHSKTNTGQKEPTDINALADEYLRLSYHGLRAKDKTFNATLQTDFDKSIGKINIVSQDIGRVLLNLYNNAFYAVNEKKKTANENYKPIVTVSTKAVKLPSGDSGVLLTVKDNGNGIPQNIVDKIFQPFFTTKPTGQGTGLGLSLSYDIIKAHGGEIKVETKDGEGTTFIVQIHETK